MQSTSFLRSTLVAVVLAAATPALAQDVPAGTVPDGEPMTQTPMPPGAGGAQPGGQGQFGGQGQPGGAGQGGPNQALMQQCRSDIATYCAGVTPGSGGIKSCVKENYRRFSDGCKAALRQAMMQRKQQAQ